MPDSAQRMHILDRLERGEINAEQAADLLAGVEPGARRPTSPMEVLEQLERGEIDLEQAAEELKTSADQAQRTNAQAKAGQVEILEGPNPRKKPVWWALGIAAGSFLAVLAALWMRSDLQDGSAGLGFICAWVPMLLGVLLITLGGMSRQSPWASVRVRSKKSGKHTRSDINLDVPLPLGLTSQILKRTGRHVEVNGVGLDLDDVQGMLDALDEARKSGRPITIQANSDDDDIVDIQIS